MIEEEENKQEKEKNTWKQRTELTDGVRWKPELTHNKGNTRE